MRVIHDEHECERCVLAVIIVHGLVGRIMQQVRAGPLELRMDVQHHIEQREYMCNIKTQLEIPRHIMIL